MKFYELHKQYLKDDFTTVDLLIRAYSDKDYTENRCRIMNELQPCPTTTFYVKEVDHD